MIFKKSKKETAEKVAAEIYTKYNDHPFQGTKSSECAKLLAFYDGHHYGDVPEQSNRQTVAAEGEGFMHRSKLNYVKPYTHIAISNLMKEAPEPLGIPTGSDLRDKQAARVVTDLCKNIYDQNERNLRNDIWAGKLNAYRCGVGYIHPYWDKDKSAIVTKNGLSRVRGDWRVSVHDVFEVFQDPAATRFEDLRWVVHAYMGNTEELKDLYPKVADQIIESTSNEIANARHAYSTEEELLAGQAAKGLSLVLEYWERPSLKHSQGRKIVVINKTILADEDNNPYVPLGHLYSIPFVPFFWDKSAERWRGNGGIRDQVPIQKEINFVATNIMKNIRLTSAMSYLVPKGAGIREQQLSGNPQIIYYNAQAGMAPTVVGGTPQASYVLQYLNFLISTQGDIAGIHEVSKAQIPERGSHMPAALYKMLQDTEAVRFSHNMRGLQSSIKLLTMFILKLIRKNWKERRYLNVLGEDKGYALKAFEKSQLEGSWDVTLKIGSAINNSPAAKIETALNLADRGILQAAEEGEDWAIKILEVIEFGDMKPFTLRRKNQLIQAERFRDTLIMKREVPDILTVYNEKIFIEVLSEFMFTKQYNEMDDEIKNVFEDAIRLLDENKLAKEQRKLQAQQLQQQQQPGQPELPPADAMQQAEMMGQGGMMPVEGGGEVPPEAAPVPGGMYG